MRARNHLQTVNPYTCISLVSFLWHNAVSDQGLHCLLTEYSIKIMKKYIHVDYKIPLKTPKIEKWLVLLIMVNISPFG